MEGDDAFEPGDEPGEFWGGVVFDAVEGGRQGYKNPRSWIAVRTSKSAKKILRAIFKRGI